MSWVPFPSSFRVVDPLQRIDRRRSARSSCDKDPLILRPTRRQAIGEAMREGRSRWLIDAESPTATPRPRGKQPTAGSVKRGSAALQRRIIARVDRMREELLFRPRPELAHVLVGLDRLVPELETVFGALLLQAADVKRADHVVQMVELDGPSRRVGQAHRLER